MGISQGQIVALKKMLEQGDVSAIHSLLEHASARDLEILREQKLLLRIHDPVKQSDVAKSYKEASLRTLTEVEASYAVRYADFTSVSVEQFQKLSRQIDESIQMIRVLSPIEMLEIASNVFERLLTSVSAPFWENLQKETDGRELSAAELSEFTEWTLHELHGTLNDIGFAGARALNVAIAVTNTNKKGRSGQRVHSEANSEFVNLVHMAVKWNSLEYAVDRVSYGECLVEELKRGTPIEVVLTLPDARADHARMIGIRRMLVKGYFGRGKRRFISRVVEDFALSTISAGIDFYIGRSPFKPFAQADLENTRSRVLRWLDLLDIEDELLLAAAEEDRSILAYYLAAVALRSFAEAAILVKRQVAKKHSRELVCPRIPVSQIVQLIENVGIPHDLALAGVAALSLELPTPHFFDIVNKPFIRVSTGMVVGLLTFVPGNWPMTVRTALVQGGPLAQSYGKIWEADVANVMQEFGWTILGQGIKIRRDRRILTDVDILAFKRGLLLVIQVKAVAGGGTNKYEQWKARGTVMRGAEQASIAADEISSNPQLMAALLSSKAVRQNVEYIQPLVVTTSPLFTGWYYQNVPVISHGYLMSLLRGAEVRFQHPDRSVVSIKHFAADKELTSEEFLELLKDPLDWQLAKESNVVDHQWVDLEDIRIAFPVLQREAFDSEEVFARKMREIDY